MVDGNMDDAHDKLVTIARFEKHTEFMVARAQLESAGIECFARNENLAHIAGGLSALWEEIELQVWDADAENATAMLSSESPLPETDGE